MPSGATVAPSFWLLATLHDDGMLLMTTEPASCAVTFTVACPPGDVVSPVAEALASTPTSPPTEAAAVPVNATKTTATVAAARTARTPVLPSLVRVSILFSLWFMFEQW